MNTTVTDIHIAYLPLCRRKLWLFAHGINIEHSSELVTKGRQVGKHSYPQQRADQLKAFNHENQLQKN